LNPVAFFSTSIAHIATRWVVIRDILWRSALFIAAGFDNRG